MASTLSSRYRGATVEDLDPPSALSLNPTDPISHALLTAFERDYTHLTVVSADTRALLGYLAIPHLRILLEAGKVKETDPVSQAMLVFLEQSSYSSIPAWRRAQLFALRGSTR